MKKEYYKVYEVSKMFKISSRHVRAKIKNLKESGEFNNRIEKDGEGQWLIHHLALPLFKRKRKENQTGIRRQITNFMECINGCRIIGRLPSHREQ